MILISIKEENVIWPALVASLLIHGLLFVFSGKTFIQRAEFSVQPSAQMVEVSVEEMKDSSVSLRGTSEARDEGPHAGHSQELAISKKTTNSEKIASSLKNAPRNDTALSPNKAIGNISISGVRVKANPDYFQNPAPEYPELAKQMRQEGLVMLSVDVDREGDPVNVVIIQSSGFRLLDQAALKAVRHWKFQPGSIGGIRVDSTVTVPIRFRLEK